MSTPNRGLKDIEIQELQLLAIQPCIGEERILVQKSNKLHLYMITSATED